MAPLRKGAVVAPEERGLWWPLEKGAVVVAPEERGLWLPLEKGVCGGRSRAGGETVMAGLLEGPRVQATTRRIERQREGGMLGEGGPGGCGGQKGLCLLGVYSS